MTQPAAVSSPRAVAAVLVVRVVLIVLGASCWPAAALAQTFSISDPENTGPSAAELSKSEEAPRFQTTLFRGEWTAQLGADIRHEDRCTDRACEDVFDLRNQLDLRLQTDVTDDLRAVVEARFDHRMVGERPEGEAFTMANANRVKGVFEPQLRDAYVRWRGLGPFDVTVGQQVVAWGVLDVASAQDVINPVDYRSGLAPGDEPPRLPIFAVRAETRLGPLHVDGVVSPFFTPHRFDMLGSDYGPLGSAAGGALGGGIGAAILDGIDESVEDDWSRTLQSTKVPQDLPGSSDVGLRLGTKVAGIDLHASYLYVWDRIPEVRSNPTFALTGGLPFDSTYSRRQVIGGDATLTAGDFVFRLESGWSPERTLYEVGDDGAPAPARRSVTLSGLGIDWTYATDLLANVETFWMRVNDVPGKAKLYLLEPDLYGAAGGLTVRFFNDDLSISARAMVTSLEDLILFPELSWRIADGHNVAGSVQIYEGKDGSTGDQFDHNDQAVIRYSRSF